MAAAVTYALFMVNFEFECCFEIESGDLPTASCCHFAKQVVLRTSKSVQLTELSLVLFAEILRVNVVDR